MWDAAHQFEGAAERAAAARVKRSMSHALGYDEPVDRPPAYRIDDKLRDFFFCNIAPLFVWIIKGCFLIVGVLILSGGTYALLWKMIMRGLEVQSRPIFFDYSPGETVMPKGMVDLRSTKNAPWAHLCGEVLGSSPRYKHDCINSKSMFRDITGEGVIDHKEDDTTPNGNVLQPGQRYFFEVTLTLPESEINKQLGVFMVEVELKSGDRSLLAMSKQHSMLPYESALISLFRKTILLLPLSLGLLSETRTITLLCFDSYVDANDRKPMTFVEVSLGVPNPVTFPATLQTIQIHSAEVNYGKEANAMQSCFRNWRYSFAFFGTVVIFLAYTLLAFSILNYRAMNNSRNLQPYADFFYPDDQSNHNSDLASHNRWMGADNIEILDDDDEKDPNAWELIDTKGEEKSSKESVEAMKNPEHDNLVSDDDSFSSKRNTSPAPKGTQKRENCTTACSLDIPANDATVMGTGPPFHSKPSDEEGTKCMDEGLDIKGRKHISSKRNSVRETEEEFLADMVMKGIPKLQIFTDHDDSGAAGLSESRTC